MTPAWANWHLLVFLVPLILAISLVYGGTRFESWRLILWYALRWGIYILLFLTGTNFLLYLVAMDVPFSGYLLIAVVAVAVLGSFVNFPVRRGSPPSEGSADSGSTSA